MSNQQNCSACADLQTDAPNLIVNGLTTTECNSLKNDTGLNPSSGNNDCTDLDNLNDCLIGNLESEVDAYDICDWKDFMKNFIPNVWTTIKAIICAICGIWTNIHAIYDKLDMICELAGASLDHPTTWWGRTPNAESHNGGAIATKGGKPIVVALPRGPEMSEGSWQMQCVGITYGKLTTKRCSDGRCLRYEWIAPYFHWFKFNDDVTPEYGDLIWSVDKATAQNKFGISDEQWAAKVETPVTWSTDYRAGQDAIIGFRLSVEDNRLCIRYAGGVGNTGAALRGDTIATAADNAERLYQFSC